MSKGDIVTVLPAVGGGAEVQFNVTDVANLNEADRAALVAWMLESGTNPRPTGSAAAAGSAETKMRMT